MLHNKKFWNVLLAILIFSIVVITIDKFFPASSHNFYTRDIMRGLFLIIILIILGSAYWRRNLSKNQLSNTIKSILLWILIFFVIIVAYAFRHELDIFKKRIVSVLLPSYTFVEDGQITLARHADGHFYLDANANDKTSIKFLIDTGASGVAITKRDAINMGFDLDKLSYTKKHHTANGVAYSAPIKIKKLQIGKKVLYNVSAHVTSGGLDISLLGMSVIDDFRDFRFVNDNLILKY